MRQSESFRPEDVREIIIDAGSYVANATGRLIVTGCNVDVFEANCMTPFETTGPPIIVENAGPATAVLEWWSVVVPEPDDNV